MGFNIPPPPQKKYLILEIFAQFLPIPITQILVDSDTKRLLRNKDEWMPIFSRSYIENREEIL